MIVSQSQQNNEDNPTNTLIPLPTFKKSGSCPLEPYHLLFHHKESLVEYGAFIKFGKRWLVDEFKFFEWLREHGEKGSHHNYLKHNSYLKD